MLFGSLDDFQNDAALTGEANAPAQQHVLQCARGSSFSKRHPISPMEVAFSCNPSATKSRGLRGQSIVQSSALLPNREVASCNRVASIGLHLAVATELQLTLWFDST